MSRFAGREHDSTRARCRQCAATLVIEEGATARPTLFSLTRLPESHNVGTANGARGDCESKMAEASFIGLRQPTFKERFDIPQQEGDQEYHPESRLYFPHLKIDNNSLNSHNSPERNRDYVDFTALNQAMSRERRAMSGQKNE